MPFDFPTSPTSGQVYTPAGGPSFSWDGTAWKGTSSGMPVTVYVSDSAPISPALGQLWWDSDSGNMYIWYVDANSSQWVQASGTPQAVIDQYIRFTTTAASAGLQFTQQDLGFGVNGAQWVWNDKADFTGANVLTVSKTGATFNLKSPAGNAIIYLDKADKTVGAFQCGIQGRMNGLVRWNMTLADGVTETGSGNTGSNFVLNRYDDAGTGGAPALMINRATKRVDFYSDVWTTGAVTAGTTVQSLQNFVATSTICNLSPTGAGTINLRPGGVGVTTGQTTIDSAGSMNVAGGVGAGATVSSGNGIFVSGTTGAYLSAQSGGTVYLRPNNSTTGQTTIDSAGAMTVASSIVTAANLNAGSVNVGTYSATGATAGIQASPTRINQSNVGAAAANHHSFYNSNGNVGNIQTNASATAYITSSDERLKDFIGPYDPDEAVAIIRADPVRAFTWKSDGSHAVGWGAQTSYAVSPDLASPPPEEMLEKEPGDEDFTPWGVDQGRRTPYLWAALTHALDEIEALKARIAVLEGAAS